jgi:hypothetical protein
VKQCGPGAIVAALLSLTVSAIAGDLPSHRLTPGERNPVLTRARICSAGFRTVKYRHVSGATSRAVYAAYGMSPRKSPCPCELDHSISIELGGSNSRRNLWPQSYTTKPWNAHVKDALETHLHSLVCRRVVSLATAQRELSGNWIRAFQRRRAQIRFSFDGD